MKYEIDHKGYGTFFSLRYSIDIDFFLSFFLSFLPFFSSFIRFLMLCWSTFSITERQKIPIDPKWLRSTTNEIILYIYKYIEVKKKEKEFEYFFLSSSSFFLSSTQSDIYSNKKEKRDNITHRCETMADNKNVLIDENIE